jgi:hypothetical protein
VWLLRPGSKSTYGVSLLMIIGTYVIAVLATQRWVLSVLLLAQTGTVWQVLRTSRARASVRLVAAVLFGLSLLAAGSILIAGGTSLLGTTFMAASLLYLLAPFSIIRDIGFRERVDGETMLGALAAYLLLGMAFGFFYQCLDAIQAGPFFRGYSTATLSDTLFFSFVTLTTTGYGDLVPAGQPGRSIALLEALIGTLFLVTAVAKVVDAWRPRAWKRSDEPDS